MMGRATVGCELLDPLFTVCDPHVQLRVNSRLRFIFCYNTKVVRYAVLVNVHTLNSMFEASVFCQSLLTND